MSNNNLGYNDESMKHVDQVAKNADNLIEQDNQDGTVRNVNNFVNSINPISDVIRPMFGDTDHDTNKTILQNKELADKSKFIKDAKADGISAKDAEKELKDIDSRTSTDAFTKQFPGSNKGGKYQKDYDDHNSIFNEFSDKAKKDQQVRADALTLYNAERDDKKVLYRGNALTHDPRAAKDGKQIDAAVNQELGMDNLSNKNGRNVGSTLSKFQSDSNAVAQSQNQASANKSADKGLEK